jgi:hypothetical protein
MFEKCWQRELSKNTNFEKRPSLLKKIDKVMFMPKFGALSGRCL